MKAKPWGTAAAAVLLPGTGFRMDAVPWASALPDIPIYVLEMRLGRVPLVAAGATQGTARVDSVERNADGTCRVVISGREHEDCRLLGEAAIRDTRPRHVPVEAVEQMERQIRAKRARKARRRKQ